MASCQKQAVGSKLDNPDEGYTGGRVTTTLAPVAYGYGGSGGSAAKPSSSFKASVTRPVPGETWNLGSGLKSIDVTTNSDAKCRYKIGTSSSVYNTKPEQMKYFRSYTTNVKTHSVILAPNVAGQSGAYDKYYKGNNYLAINCLSSSGDSATQTIQFKGV